MTPTSERVKRRYVVLRAFEGTSGMLAPGDEVEDIDFQRAQRLIGMRYLQPLPIRQVATRREESK